MDPISVAWGLAQFAPQIVKWISGSDKAAEAAGKVVDIAKTVTGKSDGQAALAAIQADPALVLQFRQSVIASEADLDKAYLADRQDARKRDVEIRKYGYNWRADLMIVGCVAALIYIVYAINSAVDIKPEVLAIFNMAVGALLKMLSDAFQFEFGSSRGSKDKDELLRQK